MFEPGAKKLRSVFLVGFLLTVALALTGYVDSSFVSGYVNLKTVGLLFSFGSIVSIIFLSYLPKLLDRLGVTGVFHLTSIIYLLSVLGMLHVASPIIFQILFILYLASGIAIYFAIDILIEHFSENRLTGNVRGFYLAIYNLAYLVGPLLAGILLKNNSFEMVYLLAGIFIIIMTLFYVRDLERVKFKSHHNGRSFIHNFLRLTKNKSFFRGYLVSLSLSFFFSWMAIYIPIYLNQFIGFDWAQIGTIFAIMHIPYVTLEIPLGRLADRCRCEPRLMTIGLTIIGVSTILLSFIADGNFWIWAAGLAITRVGASFVQVGSESYFFKRVNDKDSDMIAIFRNASPVAYILGPLVATIFLSFVSYKDLFIILGVIMILITLISSRLSNTK